MRNCIAARTPLNWPAEWQTIADARLAYRTIKNREMRWHGPSPGKRRDGLAVRV